MYIILQTHTELARYIHAGFYSDHRVFRHHAVFVGKADTRLFVYFNAKAMTKRVIEILAITGIGDNASGNSIKG